MENDITFSNKLVELAARRKKVQTEKIAFAKAQQYEQAAKCRSEEREIENEALDFLKNEAKYELTDSNQIIKDVWMVFDLVEPGETTFENAIKRINPVDLQRIHLVKVIEEYKKGNLTLDDIHSQIKDSFKIVRHDLKDKILKLE